MPNQRTIEVIQSTIKKFMSMKDDLICFAGSAIMYAPETQSAPLYDIIEDLENDIKEEIHELSVMLSDLQMVYADTDSIK